MKQNKIHFRYSVRILLKRKGKILLLERGEDRGGYSLPGGTVEPNEKPLQAIKRETFEEIGLEIKKKHLELVHTLQRRRKKNHYEIIDFYQAHKWKGKLAILEPHKFKAIRWCDEQELPEQLSPIFQLGIQAIHAGKDISYDLLAPKKVKK